MRKKNAFRTPAVTGLIAKFNETESEYQERIEKHEAEHPEITDVRHTVRTRQFKSPWLMVLRPRELSVKVTHPKFATADELLEGIDMYLEWSHRVSRPVSLIGMARFLGFADRKTMEAFCSKDETLARDPGFKDCWAYARGAVEHYTLESAMTGSLSPNVAKLVLTHHGYNDQPTDSDDPAANLRINQKFLASLGANAAVQIRTGGDKSAKAAISEDSHATEPPSGT
jgi:hypothetical protein